MENYNNLPNKTGYEEYIPFGQDKAAEFVIYFFAVLVIGLAYFLWREHKAEQAEAALHPFNQSSQLAEDPAEKEEKRQIRQQVEYMSAVDHESYLM